MTDLLKIVELARLKQINDNLSEIAANTRPDAVPPDLHQPLISELSYPAKNQHTRSEKFRNYIVLFVVLLITYEIFFTK